MGNKEEIELEKLKHENKIVELAFARETEIILMEKSWEIGNRNIQQQPMYREPEPYYAPTPIPEPPKLNRYEESAKKYAKQ